MLLSQVGRSEVLVILLILCQQEIHGALFIQLSLISSLDRRHAEICVSPASLSCAENCESDYHCGFCCFSNVCSSLAQCLIPMANIWMKHKIVSSNTYKLIHFGEIWRRNTLFQWVYLGGKCGENKINGFNFALANQTPIKLKEKLTSGQCEH